MWRTADENAGGRSGRAPRRRDAPRVDVSHHGWCGERRTNERALKSQKKLRKLLPSAHAEKTPGGVALLVLAIIATNLTCHHDGGAAAVAPHTRTCVSSSGQKSASEQHDE